MPKTGKNGSKYGPSMHWLKVQQKKTIQCAILIHMFGEESLHIYNTFSFSQDEVDTIQPLIQKCDQYFVPNKNIRYSQYFFQTYTEKGCSFDNFLTDIRPLIINLSFIIKMRSKSKTQDAMII